MNLIREEQSRLQPAYATLMQALATGNPTEHALRQANADAARTRIAALQARPAMNLRMALVNTGTAGNTEATIVMYVNSSPDGQQLDLNPAGETVQVFTGDYTVNAPFYLEIDPSTVNANVTRDAGFVLQTPNVENAAAGDQTFGSVQYYLFDPNEPVCPNPTRVARPGSGGGG